jgi:hypothetical protein
MQNSVGSSNCVAIGYNAGVGGIINGNNCTFIGTSTSASGDYSNSTCIGYNSQISGNNTINIGTSSETTILAGKLNVSGITTFLGNIIANALTITPTQLSFLSNIASGLLSTSYLSGISNYLTTSSATANYLNLNNQSNYSPMMQPTFTNYIKAQTYDPIYTNNNSIASGVITSGTQLFHSVYLTAGTSLTKFSIYIVQKSQTHNLYAGLYRCDSTTSNVGNLVYTFGDIAQGQMVNNAMNTITTQSLPYTVPTSGFYYIGVLQTYAGTPTPYWAGMQCLVTTTSLANFPSITSNNTGNIGIYRTSVLLNQGVALLSSLAGQQIIPSANILFCTLQ